MALWAPGDRETCESDFAGGQLRACVRFKPCCGVQSVVAAIQEGGRWGQDMPCRLTR